MTVTPTATITDTPTTAPQPHTWQQLAAVLKQRDHDPDYASAPVLDAYARISRSPEGDLEKTDRQLFDILRNIEHRHARLGEVLRDENLSAWSRKAKRKDWSRLVQRLEDGHATGVVAWHTDRLMRQPRDLERLVDLGDRGVLVASCFGDYDLTSADDRFTLRVLTAAAAKDSDNTSRRQKRKAAALRDRGQRNGGPRPFGMPGHLLGTDRDINAEELAAERDAIAWAVRSHLDGVSLHAIAREWNGRGLRTRTGSTWDARQLHNVLCAAHIAGLLAYQGKVVGELAGVDPIVSREEWEAIVATFKSRRRGRPVTEPYLLSGGHLLCGACEQPMTGKVASGHPRADGTPRRRYVCRNREGGCPTRVTIDAVRAETDVRAKVIKVLSDPANAERQAQASAKLREVEKKLAEEERKRDALAQRLGEDELTESEWEAFRAPVVRRIKKFKAEVAALEAAGAGEAAQAASAAQWAAEWDDPNTTVEQRRVLIRRAAPRGFLVQPATAQQRATHPDTSRLVAVR
jgi:site-specific DNA recombinase